jgi:hypothetical protein
MTVKGKIDSCSVEQTQTGDESNYNKLARTQALIRHWFSLVFIYCWIGLYLHL